MNKQSDLSAPPSVWEFLKRSGPEDGLHAVRLDTNTGPKLTSGPDWEVRRAALDGTFYRDVAEMERFASIASDKLSHEGFVFQAMRASRNLCAKEDFKLDLCKANYKEHQQKQCAEPFVDKLKCGVKLMRAVDFLCRPQFSTFTTCLKGAAGDKAKCLSQAQDFDMCTETW